MATAVEHSPAGDGGGVPSIPALIAQSVGAVENEGATALDDVRDNIVAESQAEIETPRRRRHRKRGAGAKRGRPPKNRPAETGAQDPERRSEPEQGAAKSGPQPRKAEIAAQLAQTQSELASERARHDGEKISELSKSLEMISIVAFGFVAEARGPHWALTTDEAQRIGASSAVALAPYAEKLNAQLPWMAAVTTLAAVIFKRVQIDRDAFRRLEVVP